MLSFNCASVTALQTRPGSILLYLPTRFRTFAKKIPKSFLFKSCHSHLYYLNHRCTPYCTVSPKQHYVNRITPKQHHVNRITPKQHHVNRITPKQHHVNRITPKQHCVNRSQQTSSSSSVAIYDVYPPYSSFHSEKPQNTDSR